MKFVPENLNEVENFERGIDPKRKMGIGKFYDIWRENHNNKPILKISLLLKDHFGQDYTYTVDMMYAHEIWDNRNKKADVVWFDKENIHEKNATAELADSFFPGFEEKTAWTEPEIFNKTFIDPMESNPEETFSDLMSDWFETPWKDSANYIANEWLKKADIDTGVPDGGFILEDIKYEYF